MKFQHRDLLCEHYDSRIDAVCTYGYLQLRIGTFILVLFKFWCSFAQARYSRTVRTNGGSFVIQRRSQRLAKNMSASNFHQQDNFQVCHVGLRLFRDLAQLSQRDKTHLPIQLSPTRKLWNMPRSAGPFRNPAFFTVASKDYLLIQLEPTGQRSSVSGWPSLTLSSK